MIIQINMTKVTTEQLNTNCLNIITKFSDALRRHNGEKLDLKDPCVVKKMMLKSKECQCAELDKLYSSFKKALVNYLKSSDIDIAHTFPDELLQAMQQEQTCI